jgi:MoaA/NifB/PqqE/SkfB family radical SAM enzyme
VDKKDFICSIPFHYSEVFKDRHYLCCPGWLNENVYESGDMLKDFNSEKSNQIRESLLDGSYKFCSETQCPHLVALKDGKHIDGRLVPKENFNHKTEFNNINLCFDESCNLKCPSCRTNFINFKGKDRETVEEKLIQVETTLAPTLKKMTLTGGGDPFFSPSFRKFLLRFEPSKFPKLKNIHLITNGNLWNEQLWSKLHKIHPFVETAEISIDAATKNTYENKTRLGGNWDQLMDNLKFITSINSIKTFTFSFVTQDTNYKEMLDFCNIFRIFNELKDKNYTVFFNHITNWGTFTEEQYKAKDISNPEHKEHNEFLMELRKIDRLPNVLHNFGHLVDKKKTII